MTSVILFVIYVTIVCGISAAPSPEKIPIGKILIIAFFLINKELYCWIYFRIYISMFPYILYIIYILIVYCWIRVYVGFVYSSFGIFIYIVQMKMSYQGSCRHCKCIWCIYLHQVFIFLYVPMKMREQVVGVAVKCQYDRFPLSLTQFANDSIVHIPVPYNNYYFLFARGNYE